jgi:glucose-6-phosphate 1-epimerase
MLCADGAVIEKHMHLMPGEEWTGKIQLTVVPSSFCSDRLNLDTSDFWEDGIVQNLVLYQFVNYI